MKIRVLHCVDTIASGGVEQTLLTLIRGLDKAIFEHKVICTWAGGPVADYIEKEGVEIIPIGSFKSPFEFKKLKRVVHITKRFQPHIIHGAVFEGMTMATVAGFFSNVKVTILEETSDPQNRSMKANFLLKLFSLRANVLQAISNEVSEYLVSKTKISPSKIKVIPNGVEVPEILPQQEILELRNLYGIAPNDFVVGFVGRLYNDHKRFTDLLEAISQLRNKFLKVLIVGDGRDKDLLDLEIARLKLNDQVIPVGYQPNPHRFYDMMDVLVVPSSREGFGLVAVEGMLHKLPVIACLVGGLKGIIENEVTGLHVKAYNPAEIAAALSRICADVAFKNRMGEAGYNKAKNNFTSKIYCEKIETLYLSQLKIEI
jgi:glycosyltransferase involved in cell wall biosynthesis